MIRCFECGAKDLYVMKEVEREYEGDGYDFKMNVTVPFCTECGNFIYDWDIEEKIQDVAHNKIVASRAAVFE